MIDNALYKDDIKKTAMLKFPWEKLQDKSIFITGASGLIGSYLVDVLMYQNKVRGLCCKIYALGRNAKNAEMRFSEYWNSDYFEFVSHDMNQSLYNIEIGDVDYILHLASNTHPVAYATDPIGTITTNMIGTKYLLDFAVEHHATRFAFASSNEIYGENRGDVELFKETYCGYIDCNTLRAGYPESKRCGEALCQAYMKQKDLDIVIPRFTRSYGATMKESDTKAISQFILKGVAGEDIVLKSEGSQYYSYTYVADAASGALAVLLLGKKGEAYNIADERSDIMLKDLAAIIAELANSKVIFELPDEVERAGYSNATKARLDSNKLRGLGWTAAYDIRQGIERTMKMIRAQQ